MPINRSIACPPNIYYVYGTVTHKCLFSNTLSSCHVTTKTDSKLPAAVACSQELIDAQLAAAAALLLAAAESADADDSGLPSAPLIDLAGETITEVPESLRIEDNKVSAS
jgi:hypothetical protein